MSGRSRALGIAISCVLAAGVLGLVVDGTGRVRVIGGGREYEPAAAAPRLPGMQLTLPEVHSVSDFDVTGDRLYLLDPRSTAVHRVHLTNDGYEYIGFFGRRGGGPGEFSEPSGIAVLTDRARVAVIEPGRIHLFDLEGEYIESTAPDLPCLMPRAHIGSATRGLFVYGNCVRRAVGGDTMMAVLAWSADGRAFHRLAADPLYTLDGKFGNAFGASNALGEGASASHAFGGGLQPCIFVIAESDSFPSAARMCDHSLQTFPLRVKRETREALEQIARRNPMLARTVRIPDDNPPYSQPLMLATGPALLRGYSEDSSVLRGFGSQQDVAVLPLAGLVSCRREACLVVEDRTTGTRLRLHRALDLERALQQVALGR